MGAAGIGEGGFEKRGNSMTESEGQRGGVETDRERTAGTESAELLK